MTQKELSKHLDDWFQIHYKDTRNFWNTNTVAIVLKKWMQSKQRWKNKPRGPKYNEAHRQNWEKLLAKKKAESERAF